MNRNGKKDGKHHLGLSAEVSGNGQEKWKLSYAQESTYFLLLGAISLPPTYNQIGWDPGLSENYHH